VALCVLCFMLQVSLGLAARAATIGLPRPFITAAHPDLVVQAGPDAVPEAAVAPLIAKWEGLHGQWRAAWRQLMSQVCSG
jgi:hypothetical protein